jgi:hypothetical protein
MLRELVLDLVKSLHCAMYRQDTSIDQSFKFQASEYRGASRFVGTIVLILSFVASAGHCHRRLNPCSQGHEMTLLRGVRCGWLFGIASERPPAFEVPQLGFKARNE